MAKKSSRNVEICQKTISCECDNNSDQASRMFFIHRSRKSCSSALLFGFCINDDYCGAAIAKQIDGVHHSFCAQFDQLHTYIYYTL